MPPALPARRRAIGGLTLQLLLFAVLPLTILLIVIAFGSQVLHSQAMRNMVAERQARAAHAASDAISEQIHQRGLAIQTLALLADQASTPSAALQQSAHWLRDFEYGMAIVDGDARLLDASSPTGDWTGRIPPGVLSRSGAEGAPGYVLLEPSPGLGAALVVVYAGSRHAAAGALPPASLAERILDDAFPQDSDVRVWLVTASLETLYRRAGTPEALAGLDQAALRAARVARGLVEFQRVDGVEYVAAFEPVPPLGWVLILQEPWAAGDDPLLRQTQIAPLVLVPALILTLLALAFGLRQVVQPLHALERKAVRLGQGEFEALDEPVGGISEIDSLRRTLANMAHRLQAYQQSIRRYAGVVTHGQEDERRRLARELHDDTIQALIALDHRLQVGQREARQRSPEETVHLEEARRQAQDIVRGVRRIIGGLRPVYLEDLGLPAAVQMLAEETGAAAGLQVHFHLQGEPRRLSPEHEIAVYRIAQEALSNVARHAQARQASVELRFHPGRLTLTVRDDGVGLPEADPGAEPAAGPHYGLIGMRERATLIGARLSLHSSGGAGTTIQLDLPT